jgi:hypothetical protein
MVDTLIDGRNRFAVFVQGFVEALVDFDRASLHSNLAHGRMMSIIARTVDPAVEPAHRRRLEWLRQIPPHPKQAALQAFATAETPEALEAAVIAHPTLSSSTFPDLCKTALGNSPGWPMFVARLAQLKAIARPQPIERAVDAAISHLETGRPEAALAALTTTDLEGQDLHSRGRSSRGGPRRRGNRGARGGD